MLNPTMLQASQLAQVLGGIQFSTNSTLVVPGIAKYDGSPQTFCAPLVDIPEPFSQFADMGNLAREITLDTRLGPALWDRHRIALGDINREFLQLDMEDSKLNGRNALGAALLYYSRECHFAITQANYLLTGDNDRPLPGTHGSTTIDISCGAKLLKEVASMSKNREEPAWNKLRGSLDKGSFVTPMTAFHMATILSQEILWGEFPKMALRIPSHADDYELSINAGYRSQLILPIGMNLNELRGEDMFFASLNRKINGFDPQRHFFFEPVLAVQYHAARENGIPRIGIIQRSMFSRRGAEPMAETIANLMIAAALIRPNRFPLRDFEIN